MRRNLSIYGSKSHIPKGFESQITRGGIRDMEDILLEILFDQGEDEKLSGEARSLDISRCSVDLRDRESS